MMIEMAVTVSVKVDLSGILSNKLKQLKTIKIFFLLLLDVYSMNWLLT